MLTSQVNPALRYKAALPVLRGHCSLRRPAQRPHRLLAFAAPVQLLSRSSRLSTGLAEEEGGGQNSNERQKGQENGQPNGRPRRAAKQRRRGRRERGRGRGAGSRSSDRGP